MPNVTAGVMKGSLIQLHFCVFSNTHTDHINVPDRIASYGMLLNFITFFLLILCKFNEYYFLNIETFQYNNDMSNITESYGTLFVFIALSGIFIHYRDR